MHCLYGLPVDAVSIEEAELRIQQAILNHSRCFLSTPNLNFLIACRSDQSFRHSVMSSDLVLVDGMPLIWIARLLGVPLQHRVAGASLFEHMRRTVANNKVKVFFFGGQDGTADVACKTLNADTMSGMLCVGAISPGFGSIESLSSNVHIQTINESNADFLVVSLGAQKGQAWIMHNADRLTIPVISHLGAVVNFVAGTIERSPKIFQSIGLEWLWRIKEEPHLWRRYLKDGLALARLVVPNVLPGLLLLFLRHFQVSSPIHPPHLETKNGENGKLEITLTGVFIGQSLRGLRETFGSVTSKRSEVIVISLSGVTHIDSAFLGILLILSGHQWSIGGQLHIRDVPDKIHKLFKHFGAEFLLDKESPQTQAHR